jgi:hypothetical protein
MRGTVEAQRVQADLRTRQYISCGSSMGTQKQFPEFTERRSSEKGRPSSSGVGPAAFCAHGGFEVRCAGKHFRGQKLASGDVTRSRLHSNPHALRERLKVSRSQG